MLERSLVFVVLALAIAACAFQHSVPGKVATSPPTSQSAPRAPVRRLEIPPVDGHTVPISTIAVSPSKRLVVTGSSDHVMSVWSVATGSRLRTINIPKECGSVELLRVTDEEAALLKCDDATFRQLDLRSGAETRVEKEHRHAFKVVID
ncbi:MAG TPA: hypothetical protein VM580_14725, partial [Labilithrix sp.]|nr:hypothetical protein [Labilithrix sp.]